eukprot:5156242-Pleurochrysis_carterae.AAC.2
MSSSDYATLAYLARQSVRACAHCAHTSAPRARASSNPLFIVSGRAGQHTRHVFGRSYFEVLPRRFLCARRFGVDVFYASSKSTVVFYAPVLQVPPPNPQLHGTEIAERLVHVTEMKNGIVYTFRSFLSHSSCPPLFQ